MVERTICSTTKKIKKNQPKGTPACRDPVSHRAATNEASQEKRRRDTMHISDSGDDPVAVKLTYLVDDGKIYVALDPHVFRVTPLRENLLSQDIQPLTSPPESPTPPRRTLLKKRLERSRVQAEFERRTKHRPCMMRARPHFL